MNPRTTSSLTPVQALELKVPPVAVFVICAAGMWIATHKVPAADFELPYAVFVAIALLFVGLGVAVSGLAGFRRQQTTVNPTKPEAASAIVSRGVFRITRNPMYLGLVTCLLAWGMYLQNAAALLWIAVFVAYMTRFQIKPEERALLQKFGSEYANYRSRVRRWL
jgi:protein-S-isoprenylcysteine O-methyltransferase Ste14